MNREAEFQYLCRSCEEKFGEGITGEQRAQGALIAALCGAKDIGRIPPLTTVHSCSPMRMGVADLVGYHIRESK